MNTIKSVIFDLYICVTIITFLILGAFLSYYQNKIDEDSP